MTRPGPKKGQMQALYGDDYFQRISKKGRETLMARYGREFYADIGRMGGMTTLARYGLQHYRQIRQQKLPLMG